MVEYRLDPRSGRAALMEINGRFWGSLPLAYHAGVPFAWFTYAVLVLGVVPAPPRYRAGVRCRFMVPETRRLLTLVQPARPAVKTGRTRYRRPGDFRVSPSILQPADTIFCADRERPGPVCHGHAVRRRSRLSPARQTQPAPLRSRAGGEGDLQRMISSTTRSLSLIPFSSIRAIARPVGTATLGRSRPMASGSSVGDRRYRRE